jgi:hypothetical protein
MKKKCPIVKEECWEHGCEFYTHLLGMNPQTGAQEDRWGCSISWLPVLLIENAQSTRHATAGIDRVANEVRMGTDLFFTALPKEVKDKIALNRNLLDQKGPNGGLGNHL